MQQVYIDNIIESSRCIKTYFLMPLRVVFFWPCRNGGAVRDASFSNNIAGVSCLMSWIFRLSSIIFLSLLPRCRVRPNINWNTESKGQSKLVSNQWVYAASRFRKSSYLQKWLSTETILTLSALSTVNRKYKHLCCYCNCRRLSFLSTASLNSSGSVASTGKQININLVMTDWCPCEKDIHMINFHIIGWSESLLCALSQRLKLISCRQRCFWSEWVDFPAYLDLHWANCRFCLVAAPFNLHLGSRGGLISLTVTLPLRFLQLFPLCYSERERERERELRTLSCERERERERERVVDIIVLWSASLDLQDNLLYCQNFKDMWLCVLNTIIIIKGPSSFIRHFAPCNILQHCTCMW